MTRTIMILLGVAALAACNKDPQVTLDNASGNEVAQAVRQSRVMRGEDMVRPGLWQSKVTIQEMNIPGMPAEFAAKMKQTMAQHQPEASRNCLTPEEVKKPKEDFFAGADKSCRYEHFTMGGGKIDIAMVCKHEAGLLNAKMSGSYTPTSYSMDMSSNGSGGPQEGMTMKMHVEAQRVGECTGKEG